MRRLIAVSSRRSSLSCSTLKNNHGLSSEIVVGRSNSFEYTPFSPVQLRSLIAARWASSITRWFFSSSRSEEHTSELQSHLNLVCRLLLEKKNTPASAPPPRGRAPGTPRRDGSSASRFSAIV